MAEQFKLSNYFTLTQLNKLVDDDLKEYANEIIEDIKLASSDICFNFYLDYHPMGYKRNYSLYYGFYNYTHPKPVIKKIKDGYQLQLIYRSSVIAQYHNDGYQWDGHDRSYYIFNGPFLQGYHGGPRFVVDSYKLDSRGKHVVDEYHYEPAPQTKPSPWESILKYAMDKYNAYEL